MTDLANPRSAYFEMDPTGQIAAALPVEEPPVARIGSGTLARFAAPTSLGPTYLGVLLVAGGFALIALAWADTARLTNVGLQLPYLVSAGFTGLALVMVGVVMVNVAAKRQDGAERNRQMQVLTETLAGVQRTIERLEAEPDQSSRG